MTTSQHGEPGTTASYRACVRCVMDTSDPDIHFGPDGVCNHCREYADIARRRLLPPDAAARRLEAVVDEIKHEGRDKSYDCLLGLSGGVDSSYVALQAKRLGLRPLAIHLDNGWDSETAVHNIERILRSLDYDLVTYVVDWEEFRDLQLSFLRAGVVDLELLTDHAITALAFRVAKEHSLRYMLTGNNVVTESVMPVKWTHRKSDLRNLKAIHRRFGRLPLRTLPTLGTLGVRWNQDVLRFRSVPVLDYLPYNKEEAMRQLATEVGWEYYGGKHYESLFTRFYQAHILPTKFGIDKRRAHQSALINSGQTTREAALRVLDEPLYDPALLATDKLYVSKKWQVSEQELDDLLNAPGVGHLTYPSDEVWVRSLLNLKAAGRRARRAVTRPQKA